MMMHRRQITLLCKHAEKNNHQPGHTLCMSVLTSSLLHTLDKYGSKSDYDADMLTTTAAAAAAVAAGTVTC
jgi:hypothetical protein